MPELFLISILCIALLAGAERKTGTAPVDTASVCNVPYTCISSSDCVRLHGGAGNLYNGIIFQCGSGSGRRGDELVCCPPYRPPGQGKPVQGRKSTPRPYTKPGGSAATVVHRGGQNKTTTTSGNLRLHPNYKLLPTDQCGSQTTNKIVNGEDAELGQFPWMALLGYKEGAKPDIQFYCGGSLINDRYILTAAHCVNTAGIELKRIRLGELDLRNEPDCDIDYCADPYQEYDVASVTPHPDYNSGTLKNDIALVRLKTRVAAFSDYVKPICLPFDLVNLTGAEEAKYRVSGWGKTDYKETDGSPVLQWARVTSSSIEDCNLAQKNAGDRLLSDKQLCAGGGSGEDACKGDSGGPLMHTAADLQGAARVSQIGVVSFGFRNCGLGSPSVYTRVSAYLAWILDNMSG